MTISVAKTLTSTFTSTGRITRTLSLSKTINPPPTLTPTNTKLSTITKTPPQTFTETITVSQIPTASKTVTNTAAVNVYLASATYDATLLTTHNIRRAGVPVTLLIGGDVFSVRGVEWGGAAALGMIARSVTSTGSNPTGFEASFYKEGFINDGRRGYNGNFSYLSFTVGSALFYNSYRDEVIRITVTPKGVASTFAVKGHVDLFIGGRGFMLTEGLAWLEVAAGCAAFANVAIGGQMSTALRLSANSVLVQFRCFNEEDVPLSYLQNPFRFFIDGDEQVTVMVISCCVFTFVGCMHLFITKYIQYKQQKSWPTAKGITYYPSLSIALVIIFVPNFIANAWQTALRNQEVAILVGASLLTIAFFVAPFVFILNEIYDDANCAAEYEPFDKDMIENYRHRRPIMFFLMPTGKWNSLDRHQTFAKQHYFILWEYSARARYWFCVELIEAIIGAIVSSVSNGERYLCIGQSAVLALCKILLFLGLFKYRPYNAAFWQASTMLITLTQAVIMCIKFVDVVKGETRAMESTMYALFMAVIAVILAVAFVGLSLRVSKLIYIKFIERKTVRRLGELDVPFTEPKAPVEPLRDAIVVDHLHDMYIMPTEEELKERETLRSLRKQYEAYQSGTYSPNGRGSDDDEEESDNEIEMADPDNNSILTPSGLRIKTDTFRSRASSTVFVSPPRREGEREDVGTDGRRSTVGPASILKANTNNNNSSFADANRGFDQGTSVTFSDRILPSGTRTVTLKGPSSTSGSSSHRQGRATEPLTVPPRDKGLVPRSRNLWHLLAVEEAAAQDEAKAKQRREAAAMDPFNFGHDLGEEEEEPHATSSPGYQNPSGGFNAFANSSAFGDEHESVGSSDKGSQRSGRGTNTTASNNRKANNSAAVVDVPWWSQLAEGDRVPDRDVRFRTAPPPRQPWLVPTSGGQEANEDENNPKPVITRVKYDPYYDDPSGFL